MNNIIQSNDKDFDSLVIKNDTLLLIEFWATWCGPCKMVQPIIDKLANHYKDKINIIRMETDECPVTCSQYGVTAIPTIIFERNKEIIKTLIGIQEYKIYTESIDEILK